MEFGKINKLKITKEDNKGYYLADEDNNEVVLPKTADLENHTIDEEIEVFVYNESDNNLIATTIKPYAQYEEFAFLKVNSVNKFGAFIDWGMPNELMVPFSEQTGKLEEENWYLFFVLKDQETGRLIGSRKVNDFVFFDKIDIKKGDEVDLLLYNLTDLGINVIVNNLYKGLIFTSDIHKNINPGDKIKGYVKQVRDDGKIDIVLEPLGYKSYIDNNSEIILKAIKEGNGILKLTDKSSPEDIKQILGLSKKAFKRGLGNLYKKKIVEIDSEGIKLT
jgi:predicted RNA-binding protein (virulence factor B family)